MFCNRCIPSMVARRWSASTILEPPHPGLKPGAKRRSFQRPEGLCSLPLGNSNVLCIRALKLKNPIRVDGVHSSFQMTRLVVVFEAEVGDEVSAHDVAQGVLELHGLDEEIVLWIQALARLG